MSELRLYPHESAECPHCHGVIDKDNPVRTPGERGSDLQARGGLIPPSNVIEWLLDQRPCCPHCGGLLTLVLHFTPRVEKDALLQDSGDDQENF